jgi:hypothetical protein
MLLEKTLEERHAFLARGRFRILQLYAPGLGLPCRYQEPANASDPVGIGLVMRRSPILGQEESLHADRTGRLRAAGGGRIEKASQRALARILDAFPETFSGRLEACGSREKILPLGL